MFHDADIITGIVYFTPNLHPILEYCVLSRVSFLSNEDDLVEIAQCRSVGTVFFI